MMNTGPLMQLALPTLTNTFNLSRYCCIFAAVLLLAPVKADIFAINADYETPPVITTGDAADDPAIWANFKNPKNSLIFGTDKKSGLYVYSIDGKELSYRKFGNINNVDVREINDEIFLAGTNRSTQEVVVWKFSYRDLDSFTKGTYLPDPYLTARSDINIYGLCTGLIDNNLHIFVTEDMGPNVQIWEIKDGGFSLVDTFSNQGESEGCVVDDYHKRLFISEEENAGVIRSYELSSMNYLKESVIDTREGNIGGDPEGITLYQTSESEGYIILSSQGDSKYNIYDRVTPHSYLGSFRIVGDGRVDGASDTDGIDVVNIRVPGRFHQGLLVVQDGFNTDGTDVMNQNFKIVSFKKVLDNLIK
jgi:3-phytase